MNIPLVVWLVAYAAAGLLGAKYLIPDEIGGKSADTAERIAYVLAVAFWPLWAPIASFYKIRAVRLKPKYEAVVANYYKVYERRKAASRSLDLILDRLAESQDPAVLREQAVLLEAARAESKIIDRELISLANVARRVFNKNRSFFLADTHLHRPPPSTLPEIETRCKFSLYAASNLSRPTPAWDALTNEVHRGLSAPLDVIILEMRDNRIRYSVGTPEREEGPKEKWQIIFSRGFQRAYKRADKHLQQKAAEAISSIVSEPMTARGNTIARLQHDKTGLWRFRFGDHRLIYLPLPQEHQVVLVRLAHRSDAYSG